MRQFIAFIKKEFYHIFRDRRTMLILLGMPVVQIILFGFAISTEVKNVRLAVLDPSNDVVTRKIIDRLDASEYFTVTARFHSPQEMEAAFLKNEVDMALGNAIGSNIFNILMVLGIASAISPMAIITENIIDLCVLIVFTVCVWIFAGTKKKIGRVEGFCMVAFYAAYAIYIIIR